MDIAYAAELMLRDWNFKTWMSADRRYTSFESPTILGFLHVFDSVEQLVVGWQSAQLQTLQAHAPSLRYAHEKAWNVYSIFLTEASDLPRCRAVDKIEEDFALSRKIARMGIQTTSDLKGALTPILPMMTSVQIQEEDFSTRLRARLSELPSGAVDAFLGSINPEDVAAILADSK